MRYEAELQAIWPWPGPGRGRMRDGVAFARWEDEPFIVMRVDAENPAEARDRILEAASALPRAAAARHIREPGIVAIYDQDIVRTSAQRWARERASRELKANPDGPADSRTLEVRIRAALREIDTLLTKLAWRDRPLRGVPACAELLLDGLPLRYGPVAAISELLHHDFRFVDGRHAGDLTADGEMLVKAILLGSLEAIAGSPTVAGEALQPRWRGSGARAATDLARMVAAITAGTQRAEELEQVRALVLAAENAGLRQARRLRAEARQIAELSMLRGDTAIVELYALPPEWLPTTRVAVPLDMVEFACSMIAGGPPFVALAEMARLSCGAAALLECSVAILGDVDLALRRAAVTHAPNESDEHA